MSELSYKEAGVDIEAGDHFVDEIKAICHSTYREEVLSPLGGFGALFRLPTERYREPVLVSSTDGVGTKLKLAFAADRHETVGIDLVAMCVNDILVLGAEPLFFLDYMATGRLKGEQAVAVLRGIAEGCRQAKCALIGGETAEMPGFYAPGEYDLAGFSVGVVERGEVIDGRTIGPGDRLIGLPSSGVHSNGFSLVRLVLERHALALGSPFDTARSLADVLLEPTRIYFDALQRLAGRVRPKGIAHITGGGIAGNLRRVLPEGCHAEVDLRRTTAPAVFSWLRRHGVSLDEMARTFNCGLGLILVVAPEQTDEALELLGEGALVGAIDEGERGVSVRGLEVFDG